MTLDSGIINRHQAAVPKRRFEFDLIKCFAIFLVLWGHSIMHFTEMDKHSNLIYQLIYSFHMPLFMMVAGFFCKSSMNLNFSIFLPKKLWQLIYPCLTFGVIFFSIELLLFNKEIGSIYQYLYGSFWFLKSCFLCYLVFYLCLKLCNNRIIYSSALAIVLSQFIPIFKLPFMMPFFVLGYILNNKWEYFLKNNYKLFWLSMVFFIPVFYLYNNTSEVDLGYIKERIMNSGDLSSIQTYLSYHILRLSTGLLGSVFCLSLFNMISAKIEKYRFSGFLSEAGKHTLGIYLLQTLILESVLSKYFDLTDLSPILFNFIIVPVISLVILIVCLAILNLIDRNLILKRLLWGK